MIQIKNIKLTVYIEVCHNILHKQNTFNAGDRFYRKHCKDRKAKIKSPK